MKAHSIEHDLLLPYRASQACVPEVRQYLDAALSANTLLAYRADLRHFLAWGGEIPATPEMLANYVAHYGKILAESTLSRRLVAIGQAHMAQGLVSPTHSALVRATLKGVRRARSRPIRQVAALQKSDVLKMISGLKGLHGLRDAALLLIGFAGALRRSELVALDIDDLAIADQGIVIRLRRSKTDPLGRGREVVIPHVRGRQAPGRVLLGWLEAADIRSGALFRRVNRYDQVQVQRLTAQSVALIIKQRAAAAGLDPGLFSGHSLRAGFVTNAAGTGASTVSIREQTGHQSDAMLQRYIRNAERFKDNPLSKIW